MVNKVTFVGFRRRSPLSPPWIHSCALGIRLVFTETLSGVTYNFPFENVKFHQCNRYNCFHTYSSLLSMTPFYWESLRKSQAPLILNQGQFCFPVVFYLRLSTIEESDYSRMAVLFFIGICSSYV